MEGHGRKADSPSRRVRETRAVDRGPNWLIRGVRSDANHLRFREGTASRGIFDEETRRKPLAVAVDAL